MKAKLFKYLVAAFCSGMFIATAPVSGSGQDAPEKKSMQDVRKEVGEAASAIKGYSVSQRDKAVQEAGKALADVDTKIERTSDRIRMNWARMDKTARVKAAATMRELYKKRSEAAEWFGGLKHSSDKAWDEMKGGFLKSYETLHRDIQEAARKF